jgi:aerobic carbon-monoxide dehydrogenase small subunit
MTTRALLDKDPDPSEETIRHAISGQICRCTGYASIVRSVQWAAEHERQAAGADPEVDTVPEVDAGPPTEIEPEPMVSPS